MDKDIRMPLSTEWSTEQIVDVVNFFEAVDKAYNKGVGRNEFLTLYTDFKKVVPSKAEEKQHFKDYEEQTGQSPYKAVKKAREDQGSEFVSI
ncbi:UPF0223 family protein [Alkalicoccus halolimnae]|uniref:UPF0223 family protein n=1 Tax=Alkalicoccus halolimnae TaxID=1667239 RepID=A0AAJ8LTX1_9BACI|nr:UPF0223 family protein [Alkalicoccus halolimnae]